VYHNHTPIIHTIQANTGGAGRGSFNNVKIHHNIIQAIKLFIISIIFLSD